MIRLELCEEIYSKENIKQVIIVYEEYAFIKMKSAQGRCILEFRNCKYDEDITVKEFENYLIGLENVKNGLD